MRLVIFLIALFFAALPLVPIGVSAQQHPHIVFAIADDWGWPHASIYGNDDVCKTPTFDAAWEGASTQWGTVTQQLPAEALDKLIKIEFRLKSDSFNNLPGWHIDDVEVTTPAP